MQHHARPRSSTRGLHSDRAGHAGFPVIEGARDWEWLALGLLDEARAELLQKTADWPMVAFLTQQSAEKYAKFAFRKLFPGRIPNRTHSINVVLTECAKADARFLVDGEFVDVLSSWATAFHYPRADGVFSPEPADVAKAGDLLRSIGRLASSLASDADIERVRQFFQHHDFAAAARGTEAFAGFASLRADDEPDTPQEPPCP